MLNPIVVAIRFIILVFSGHNQVALRVVFNGDKDWAVCSITIIETPHGRNSGNSWAQSDIWILRETDANSAADRHLLYPRTKPLHFLVDTGHGRCFRG